MKNLLIRMAVRMAVGFLLFIFLLGFLLGFAPRALARPEYATHEKLNCAACHAMPWGGGPRVVFGKVYGAHGLTPAATSTNDLYYGEARVIGYYPTREIRSTTNGLALMQASATGNIPIFRHDDGGEFRAVLTYNLAPLSGAEAREGYVRWQMPGRPFSQILIGRFYMPFGLLTDEHRTYTKLQTSMTLNNYDLGVGGSTDFLGPFHADAAVVNDFQSGGSFSNKDTTWAGVLNLRWNPSDLPLLLGVSGNYEFMYAQRRPFASSLYAVLSLDRLTHEGVHGSLQFERVDAFHWNNPATNVGQVNSNVTSFFVPSALPGEIERLRDAPSLGYYGMAKFHLWPQFLMMYKFDYLALQKNHSSDNYTRHGLGFEAFLNSNLILDARYELATTPGYVGSEPGLLAAQDDVFLMLRVWL